MYSQSKFTAMNPKGQAKVLADLLRHYLLQLGKEWKQAPRLYDQYATWIGCAADLLLLGNTPHHRVLDLYTHWRHAAGLGPERDMYLQQEPGDRAEPVASALPYAVLAHNLRSAYNVGSLFRSVDCFGLSAVHLSGYTPDTEHPALRSAARGCENWIATQRWESPFDCIAWHQQQGYAIVALETGEDAYAIDQVVWPDKALILVGNEELGIAPELVATCTHKIVIPMRGRKASLNVASAFAIMAYEISRGGRANVPAP